jgi:hypothetical protein
MLSDKAQGNQAVSAVSPQQEWPMIDSIHSGHLNIAFMALALIVEIAFGIAIAEINFAYIMLEFD